MALNGISTLGTKELRQKTKLDLAQDKRQGKVVAYNGTVSGVYDPTAPYFRINNSYDILELPTQYVDNSIFDNPNPSGLLAARPWIPTIIASGESIQTEDAIDVTTEGGDILIAE